MDSLITSKKAAEILCIREDTLRRWRTIGKGPAFIKDGNMIRYSQSEIQSWINKRSNNSGND